MIFGIAEAASFHGKESNTEDAAYAETRRGKKPAKLKPVSLAGEAVFLWIKQFGEARVFLEERKILVIARVIAVFRA